MTSDHNVAVRLSIPTRRSASVNVTGLPSGVPGALGWDKC